MSICGVPSTWAGSGISSMIVSSSGTIESVRSFHLWDIHPCLAEP